MTIESGKPALAADILVHADASGNLKAAKKRQGGSATEWATYGTTEYEPTNSIFQVGIININYTAGQASANKQITYPDAFAKSPLIVCQILTPGTEDIYIEQAQPDGYPATPSASTFTFIIKPLRTTTFAGSSTAVIVWFAVGPVS